MLALGLLMMSAGTIGAQQAGGISAMGTVPTRDALVTGGLEVRGEQASLLTNASVTAFDHTASVKLARGGEVLVCSTSQFHLLHSGGGSALLFGLDRGAVEIHSPSQPQDVLLTPDIRFGVEGAGEFDLRVRVTREGDTCVENAGARAPVLTLSDVFSSRSYRLLPGQHVLFERGDLSEVVDTERSACGCPAAVPVAASAPETVAAAAPGQATYSQNSPATSSGQAAAKHPFPEAASNDLAPAAPVSNSPPGEKNTQIATTFEYGEGKGPPPSTVEAKPPAAKPPAGKAVAAEKADTTGQTADASRAGASTTPNASTSQRASTASASESTTAQPPPAPPGAHDIAHAIGRFFHRLFHPRR